MISALAGLTAELHRRRRALDRDVGQARHVAQTGKTVAAEVAALSLHIEHHDQAVAVLTRIAEARQSDAQAKIEALVTQGIRTIFGTEMSFHLIPGIRAKTPVVDFVVRSELDGVTVDTDVMNGRGGGLAAVIGVLLNVVVLLLSHDKTNNTLLKLDETVGHLSAEYEPRFGQFLRQLVDATGIQITMVTHSDAFIDLADVCHRFTLVEGITKVASVGATGNEGPRRN